MDEVASSGSGQPVGSEDRLRRALQNHKHGHEALGFLMFAKAQMSCEDYKELVKRVQEIVKQSSNPEGGITAQKCEEILSQVFAGKTCLLKGFHHFLKARDPSQQSQNDPHSLQGALSFLKRVKNSKISAEDYNDLLAILSQCLTTNAKAEDIYTKVKRAMRQCPELIETFETYLPPRLRVSLHNKQSSRSPNTSPTDKVVLCLNPDANHSLDVNRMKTTSVKYNMSQLGYTHDQDHEATEYNSRQKHTQGTHESLQTPTIGNGESLYAEENDGDKTDPLPEWSTSRENELPPEDLPDMLTRCTVSYSLLPENCLTLKTSYRTEMGRSILNDTLVPSTSGSEYGCTFRTKNRYEETIFKCEDDMFETDMILQRYKATADFIRNLQGYVDSNMKIQKHLTPLHKRCIQQLYDKHGLDMLDALSEKIDTSVALDILHSRLNQKIEDLSEARLYLTKKCSKIIAKNYHRSLDHRSPSFKLSEKDSAKLLNEAREINMARLNNVGKHVSSACNNQSSLISENLFKDVDLHIHEDIDRMVRCASKSCPDEQNVMMLWTTLVQPFVPINCQLQESNGTIAPKEACERCGLSKTFLSSIPDSSFANNLSISSKKGGCGYLLNTSNKYASTLDACQAEIEDGEFIPSCQAEIEDGEFIPDVGDIQFGSMLGHGNEAASCDVAAPSGGGSIFQYPGRSICDHSNKSEVHHESREGHSVEMGSSTYFKRTAELYDVIGSIPCCSLAVLLRLHQILYKRLVVAKVLSDKASKRDSRTCDLYERFKKELFNLLTGSTNSSNFEEYCLKILGPGSYELFTLHEVIDRVIKQLCKICSVSEDNSIVHTHEEVRGPDTAKDLYCHQNARTSPGCPTNGSLEQQQKDGKHNDDIVKPMQNHFQRRKKRKLENSPPFITRPRIIINLSSRGKP